MLENKLPDFSSKPWCGRVAYCSWVRTARRTQNWRTRLKKQAPGLQLYARCSSLLPARPNQDREIKPLLWKPMLLIRQNICIRQCVTRQCGVFIMVATTVLLSRRTASSKPCDFLFTLYLTIHSRSVILYRLRLVLSITITFSRHAPAMSRVMENEVGDYESPSRLMDKQDVAQSNRSLAVEKSFTRKLIPL